MALHLIKLCVGIDSIEHLAEFRAKRRLREPRCLVHTRNWPRRADEILDGGSLFWVIRGHVRVRQRVLAFHHDLDEDGRGFCTIELDHALVPTRPLTFRPFQGWRYMEPADAPADETGPGDYGELPEQMARELREIGVI
jgi:hypothetical protein